MKRGKRKEKKRRKKATKHGLDVLSDAKISKVHYRLSEQNDSRRYSVETCIDSFRPERDHIEGIRANVNFLHRKIVETEEEDVDHNIRTVTKYKLDDAPT